MLQAGQAGCASALDRFLRNPERDEQKFEFRGDWPAGVRLRRISPEPRQDAAAAAKFSAIKLSGPRLRSQ